MFSVERYHDISCGHRVVGHESKCQHLHGHNYRIRFTCSANDLDKVGRVIDFSVIKEKLCMWLEENWDHKFLAWYTDPVMKVMVNASKSYPRNRDCGRIFEESMIFVPFNPTAENMAKYLVEVVGPTQLEGTGIVLTKCVVEETRKCSASFEV